MGGDNKYYEIFPQCRDVDTARGAKEDTTTTTKQQCRLSKVKKNEMTDV